MRGFVCGQQRGKLRQRMNGTRDAVVGKRLELGISALVLGSGDALYAHLEGWKAANAADGPVAASSEGVCANGVVIDTITMKLAKRHSHGWTMKRCVSVTRVSCTGPVDWHW
jgi:hypothetical protein